MTSNLVSNILDKRILILISGFISTCRLQEACAEYG
jgi:hypothetical protein